MHVWSFPTAELPEADVRCAGRTLLLVGTCEAKRRHTLTRLRALGLARVLCLNPAVNWAADLIDGWILADPAGPIEDVQAAVAAHLAAHPGQRIDGVLTFDEYFVQATAAVAEQLGVPGIPPAVAARARDKLAFRQHCAALGLPTPGHARLLSDPAEAAAPAFYAEVPARIAAHGLHYPLVVKPAFGGGSTFVRKVADADELRAAIAAFCDQVVVSDLARTWADHSLFVETYLQGPEVDLDVLVQGGEVRYCAVTDNFAPIEPYFMEQGGQCPSALSPADQAALRALAGDVVRALGVPDGCLHLEARVTPAGPVPIEANLRLGGAEVYAFNRGVWGVDMIAEVVAIALGQPVQVPDAGAAPLAWMRSRNFVPAHSGRIVAQTVPPALRTHPALSELVLFREIGEAVAVPPDGFQYCGWLVTTGASHAAAAEAMVSLAGAIAIHTEPPSREDEIIVRIPPAEMPLATRSG